MKLNRKGYLAVEIILSSVIAMTIAFFLITLTMKLTDKNNDTYLDNILFTDKVLITKNIKELIENDISSSCGIDSIECGGNICTLYFKTSLGGEFGKDLKIENNQISYGNTRSTSNYDYVKEFNANLGSTELLYNGKKEAQEMIDDDILNFRTTLKTLYSDYDYGFNFSVINEKRGRNGKIYLDYYQNSSKLTSLDYRYNTCDPNFDWYIDISNDLNSVLNPIVNKIDCYSDVDKTIKYMGEIRNQGSILEFSSDIPLTLYCDVNK